MIDNTFSSCQIDAEISSELITLQIVEDISLAALSSCEKVFVEKLINFKMQGNKIF